MKLLDYIRGLRKGKEAHRLEKESMKDPFLADAMDGYHQVEGDHEEQINKLRMKVNAVPLMLLWSETRTVARLLYLILHPVLMSMLETTAA